MTIILHSHPVSDFWKNRRIARSLGYKRTSDYLADPFKDIPIKRFLKPDNIITVMSNPGEGMTHNSNFFESKEETE